MRCLFPPPILTLCVRVYEYIRIRITAAISAGITAYTQHAAVCSDCISICGDAINFGWDDKFLDDNIYTFDCAAGKAGLSLINLIRARFRGNAHRLHIRFVASIEL